MNTLLDTHAFIWYITGDEKFSKKARQSIEIKSSDTFLSIASLWEIAIKTNLGKLELKISFSELYHHIEINNFKLLPITFEDTLIVANLPLHHRDPFDRLLIAQCMNNDLTLISKDLFIKDYSINQIW